MEEAYNRQHVASSSTTSSSEFQVDEAFHELPNEENDQDFPFMSYWTNFSLVNPHTSPISDDGWSCIIVIATYWLFATALILGIYGSMTLQLGPYSSHLIEVNSMFVQSIMVEQIDKQKPGIMLYGFDEPPPLDVKINWSHTYDGFVPSNFHKEWIFHLNKGSELEISYKVNSPRLLPLSLVIAKGREELVEWIKDPSFPNSTLSWNIIYGTGRITHNISHSYSYYVALDNLNTENVKVELKFSLNSFLYNTSSASSKCSPLDRLCKFNVLLSESSPLVLTTPPPTQGVIDDEWFDVKVSYGPRWMTYFTGTGMMSVAILFVLRFCNNGFQFQTNESEREAPLLGNKNDDVSSLGSSYESLVSNEEEDDVALALNNNGESVKRLCMICFDAPRDCFFLPCAHSAACFACGTRIIAAQASTCPICTRTIRKVRKIINV